VLSSNTLSVSFLASFVIRRIPAILNAGYRSMWHDRIGARGRLPLFDE
jgi:hypothetical protein